MGANAAYKNLYGEGDAYHEIGTYVDIMDALDVPVTDKRIWVMVGDYSSFNNISTEEYYEHLRQKNLDIMFGFLNGLALPAEVRKGDYVLELHIGAGKSSRVDILVVRGFITLSDGSRLAMTKSERAIEPYGSYEGAFFTRTKVRKSEEEFCGLVKGWVKAQPHNKRRALLDMTGFVELSTLYNSVKQQGMEG